MPPQPGTLARSPRWAAGITNGQRFYRSSLFRQEALVHEEPHRTPETKPHAIRPQQEGGGAGKWLLGAAAAALIVGGGYFAWKNMGPQAGDQTAQAAYEQQYADMNADGTMRAAPLPASGAPSTLDNPTFADDAPPATTASSSTTRTTAARRTTTTRTAAASSVPEETIGVTPASITTADQDDIVVPAPRRPVWTSTPNARRLTAMYPQRALERGREGEARLSCIVGDAGRLDCDRVSETPGGFGAAAVRVARSFRHATTTADGRNAVGTPVNLRVVFRIEEDRRRG